MATTPAVGRDPLPTLPEKGYSGTAIKGRVVQSMTLQHEANRAAFEELERLERLLCSIDMDTIPPPPAPQPEGAPQRSAARQSPGRYRARSPLDSRPH